MCCIFGFINWSLNCIQRSITFVLVVWVIATILYALALGLSAGVAFGYEYALAENKIFASPEAKLTVRATGIRAIGDEFETRRIEALDDFTPPTLWLYELSRQYTQPDSPSTLATRTKKIYYKMTKERKMSPSEEGENDRLLKVKPLIYRSTTRRQDSTLSKSDSTKRISTYPKSLSTNLKSKMTTKKSTTSLWPSSIMRIFKRKSTFMKWRPTKPNKKFFYRTLPASHTRKTIGDSYGPEMKIRTYSTSVHEKYERLPMRVWDTPTRTTEATETSVDGIDYRNIMYF